MLLFRLIDLATDYRLLPARATAEGPVLATPEPAADKVLALEARAEARDYVDFQSLAERFSMRELCELAGRKDLGFRPQLPPHELEPVPRTTKDAASNCALVPQRLRQRNRARHAAPTNRRHS